MASKLGLSTFIGEQISGIPYPAFFDIHYALTNNKPPGTLITGSPGSGKTFFGLTLATHASIMGKTGIILDPKGDFIAMKKLEQEGITNKINIWNLVGESVSGSIIDDGNEGILDPTSFYEKHEENVSLTVDVIRDLNGGSLTTKQSNFLTPITQDIVVRKDASFSLVVQRLMRSEHDEVRSLGIKLDNMLRTGLAKLLSTGRRGQKNSINLRDGVTIVNLMGLSLPLDTKPRDTWSEAENLSTTIMSLITRLILDSMRKLGKIYPKFLMIDEAWSVMATNSGRTMISSIGLLGRSLNMALILLTQSPKHIIVKEGASLDTVISVRFAFRNNSDEDNAITIKSMKLPDNEGWEEIGPNLSTGQCLMQDSESKYGVIQVLTPDEWIPIFNTNPTAVLEGN